MIERMEDVEGVVRGTARTPELTVLQCVLVIAAICVFAATFVTLMVFLAWN